MRLLNPTKTGRSIGSGPLRILQLVICTVVGCGTSLWAAPVAPAPALPEFLVATERVVYRLEVCRQQGLSTGILICSVRREFLGQGEEWTHARDEVEIDCQRDTYRYTSIVIFDRDDLVMHRYRPADQLCSVPPDSPLARLQERACPPR